jgi:hypothetical protein
VLRSRRPWRRATLRLLPVLVATPPLGYPGDVPDLLLLHLFVFSDSDRVCVSIAHILSARASSTSASTTPAPSSSPTVLHGSASSMSGDARMLFLCLFANTSIYVGSSSPLLVGRFCHRRRHHRLHHARCLSSKLIVCDLTLMTYVVYHEFLNQARGLPSCRLFGQ